jgi:hypothetical protein
MYFATLVVVGCGGSVGLWWLYGVVVAQFRGCGGSVDIELPSKSRLPTQQS